MRWTRRRKVLLVIHELLVALVIVAAWCWFVVYDNHHVVIEGELYRSAQVSGSELRAYIERDGLATIISLRENTNTTWWSAEKAVCEQAGVTHVDVPLAGTRAPTVVEMQNLVTTLRNAMRPLLIHCRHGADRTSLAVALYLNEKNSPEHDPLRAFSPRYGHLPALFRRTRCFDDAFDTHRRTSGGQ